MNRSFFTKILQAPFRLVPRSLRMSARQRLLSALNIPQDPGEQAAALIAPLVRNGTYKRYADVWLKAGFVVVPDRAAVRSIPPEVAEKRRRLPELKPAFLPNLFLLGVAKAGTSTLHAYLQQIPDVCMSLPKEPTFFACKWQLGLDYYQRRYFAHWQGERYIGDASPVNIHLPFVPERIHRCNRESKLLLVLRNPIERAYSAWWMSYSKGHDDLSFREAIATELRVREQGYLLETQVEIEAYCAGLEPRLYTHNRNYLRTGEYMQHIERYLRFFPREQLKIVLLDDLASKPLELLQDVERFLGTNYYNESTFELQIKNEHPEERKGRAYVPLPAEDRAWLADYFAPHIARLAEFLNRDLSHWR